MIEATVAAANGRGTPPPLLSLAQMCGPYHLPESGGVLDQDYRQYITMRTLHNIHDTIPRVRAMTGTKIHNMSAADKRVVKMLIDMGLWEMGLHGG
jgi:hypothetical protein